MIIKKSTNIHIAGIGGIGTSGLARILKAKGKKVSGSDESGSEITQGMSDEGIRVFIGEVDNVLDGIDLLVYSSAISTNHPLRKLASQKEIAQLSYSEALGEVLSDYKVIAVSGTNGKTTTTAMIAHILEESGFDPSALVGSIVSKWRSNARVGNGDWFVVEADEYRRAFLHYPADIAVIINISEDHLDYYKDLSDIKNAFSEFTGLIKPGGVLIYDESDINSRDVAGSCKATKQVLDVKKWQLKVPGKYNQINASFAAQAAHTIGVSEQNIRSALASFTGTWRRFEFVGQKNETKIFSDYAHHPDGLNVLFKMLEEEYSKSNVLVVFQPHQHNRTKMLFDDFVESFIKTKLQNFIITEIFDVAGREEQNDQNISSKDLVREINKHRSGVIYSSGLEDTQEKVESQINDVDIVVFVGAGDIYKIANNIVKKI